jgi:hypothetical protein
MSTHTSREPNLIDPRGPRFTTSITVVVLAVTLLTHSWVSAIIQLVQFTIGGFISPRVSPYGLIFRKIVQPQLKTSAIGEDIRGPQFAQKVGFLFAVLTIIGLALPNDIIFYIGTGGALAAAFLNAAFNYCLGCQMYLLLQKALHPAK